MAIQPIDLQVLFSRLNQLGKEQADQRDSQIHTQVILNAEGVKRAQAEEHSVTGAPETEGGNVRQVKDENRRHQREKARGDGEKKEEENGDAGTPEVITESYLGKKINITG
ncbi:MAG: hypothetical protein LBK13_01850 [Spirochaetales bacterium]|jgi:hypothetical protein|nr:hypothetical protein [Spirochaetales bacterium]